MREKKYSIRFTDKESERYKKLMEQVRSPNMSTLIRDLLETAYNNPEIINPVQNKTNLDVIMKVLEISAEESIKSDENFQKEVFSRLNRLEKGLDLMMTKMKIPKKKREKIKEEDDFESNIFD